MSLSIKITSDEDSHHPSTIIRKTSSSIIYKNNEIITKKLLDDLYKNTLNRIKSLIDNPHPNICEYKSIDYMKKEIKMKYYEQDFFDMISQKTFSRKQTYKFFKDAVKAVGHIHSLNIVHTDIKIDNFMVDNDNLILIDFEITNGSSIYSPPENEISKKSDIWNIGIFFYALLYCEFPFISSNDTCAHFVNYKKTGYLSNLKNATKHEEEIIRNTLCIDMDKRWSIQALLKSIDFLE